MTEFRKDNENFKLNKVNIEDLYKPLLIMLREIHLYCINSIYKKKLLILNFHNLLNIVLKLEWIFRRN